MIQIGPTLREARMRRGLEIGDCESATKIRGKYLRALEEEQFESMPGPTFVRGFLKTYADFLELDPRAMVDAYEVQFARPRETTAFEEVLRRTRTKRRSREGRLLVALAVIALIASGVVWTIVDGPPATAAAGPMTAVFATIGTQATYVEAHEGSTSGRALFTPGTISPRRPLTVQVTPPIAVHVGDGSGLALTLNGRRIAIPPGRSDFRVLASGTVIAESDR